MGGGIISICKSIASKLRMAELRNDTPEFERYIYVTRKGFLEDLENAFGKQMVLNTDLIGYLKTNLSSEGKIWKLTKRGKEDIKTFNSDVTVFDKVKGFLHIKIV